MNSQSENLQRLLNLKGNLPGMEEDDLCFLETMLRQGTRDERLVASVLISFCADQFDSFKLKLAGHEIDAYLDDPSIVLPFTWKMLTECFLFAGVPAGRESALHTLLLSVVRRKSEELGNVVPLLVCLERKGLVTDSRMLEGLRLLQDWEIGSK